MISIATGIKAHANDLFVDRWGIDLAQRASMLACTAQTDLGWSDITAVHDRPAARRANNRATVAYRRRLDLEVDRRYVRLLDHAQALRRAGGYANAHLEPGLIPRTGTARPLAATGN